MDALIVTLQQKQQASGLTDTAFAKLLGIDRSTWVLAKQGKRQQVGHKTERFFRAILRAYPDLWPVFTSYLMAPEK